LLEKAGEDVARFDTATFPRAATLSAHHNGKWCASLSLGDGQPAVDLSTIRSLWYRRPTRFDFPAALSPAERNFAAREAEVALGGLLRLNPNCRWVNHPERMVLADYKPLQLEHAARLGLRVPRTLVTNDPSAVADFYEACNHRIVFKVAANPLLVERDGSFRVLYTSLLSRADMERIDRVRNTACLFQEYVDKAFELRLTVIGEEIFAAAINSQRSSRSATDWRRSYQDLHYRRYDLPEDVSASVRALVRTFGLVFGAIDMIVTPSGEHVFLELNPNGQWEWIEHELDLPISEAMARHLACAC